MINNQIEQRRDGFEFHLDCSPLVVKIGSKKYSELLCQQYTLFYNREEFVDGIDGRLMGHGDFCERAELIEELEERIIPILSINRNSRQAVIQKKYQGDLYLAACLSLFQFIIRDQFLHMYVFVRSQHIDNFLYDNATYVKLASICMEKLNVQEVFINVHITSLHREYKDD